MNRAVERSRAREENAASKSSDRWTSTGTSFSRRAEAACSSRASCRRCPSLPELTSTATRSEAGVACFRRPQPLVVDLGRQKRGACAVTAGASQRSDEAAADRIPSGEEHEGNRGACPSDSERRVGPTRHDHVDVEPNEIVRQQRKPLGIAFRPAVLHGHVPPFDVTRPPKATAKRLRELWKVGRSGRADHAHPRHPSRLGLGGARHRTERQQCTYRVASVHSVTSHCHQQASPGSTWGE